MDTGRENWNEEKELSYRGRKKKNKATGGGKSFGPGFRCSEERKKSLDTRDKMKGRKPTFQSSEEEKSGFRGKGTRKTISLLSQHGRSQDFSKGRKGAVKGRKRARCLHLFLGIRVQL